MRKKLKIAQVSPLWYPVPPIGYGGTEFVVSVLTEELIKRGHKVTLFASGDSKTKANLVSVSQKNIHSLKVPWEASGHNILNLIQAFSQEKDFDILHTHIDRYDLLFRAKSKSPTVATLHNLIWPTGAKKSGKWHNLKAVSEIYARFPDLPYIAISNSYQNVCPIKINFVKTIYHGLMLNKFKFNQKPDNYFVWLGRITKAKGLDIAVRLARKMKFKLLIAGVIRSESDRAFFEKDVKPFFSNKIKFKGELKSESEKSAFLGKAKALLYPLMWEEPFGIVMVESQACGTPVIAFDRGSAKEVIANNKTGFVVKNEQAMIKAINNIERISRSACRQWVKDNFSAEKMAQEHEKLYYQLIKKKHHCNG